MPFKSALTVMECNEDTVHNAKFCENANCVKHFSQKYMKTMCTWNNWNECWLEVSCMSTKVGVEFKCIVGVKSVKWQLTVCSCFILKISTCNNHCSKCCPRNGTVNILFLSSLSFHWIWIAQFNLAANIFFSEIEKRYIGCF